ncbi:MAG: hypothetical protein HRU38_14310 [Saccharospirillaceae bacterium]|nr:hypothetical protein [Saccharospirillaceae bacterium]
MRFFKGLFLPVVISVSSVAIAQDEGNVLSSSVWDSNVIPVCWESFTESSANQRSWIQNAVSDTWSDNSRAEFTGWGQCSSGSAGVRIQVSDVGPHVKGLGKNLNGLSNGMVLNFTYNNWSPSCQSDVQYCSEVIAIHEFGHALGFAHEQNRTDTPDSCTDSPQGTDGDVYIGKWDLDSVMNYCNPQWNAAGELSETDIVMVQKYYDSEKLILSSYDDLPAFSADYYLLYNHDIARAFGKSNFKAAKEHWDKHGKKEGRVSSPSFNVKEYISLYSDLTRVFGTNYAAAVNHFKVYGIKEGRKSSKSFDVKFYLSSHSDLKRVFGATNYLAAHKHWAQYGLKEGRRSTSSFDVSNYLDRYNDLKNAFGDNNYLAALQHWIRYGLKEGRNGN